MSATTVGSRVPVLRLVHRSLGEGGSFSEGGPRDRTILIVGMGTSPAVLTETI